MIFSIKNEPYRKCGIQTLNPYCLAKLYTPNYDGVENPCGVPLNSGYNSCDTCVSNPGYLTNDPRLISGSHNGQRLVLNTPPYTSTIKLANIYSDPNLNLYGQKYTDYGSINAGQITYYNDKSIEDAFYSPVFANSATVTGYDEKDPMSSVRPYYDRNPVVQPALLKTVGENNDQLTWLRDSGEFREDIISKQMRRINRQKYTARWF